MLFGGISGSFEGFSAGFENVTGAFSGFSWGFRCVTWELRLFHKVFVGFSAISADFRCVLGNLKGFMGVTRSFKGDSGSLQFFTIYLESLPSGKLQGDFKGISIFILKQTLNLLHEAV